MTSNLPSIRFLCSVLGQQYAVSAVYDIVCVRLGVTLAARNDRDKRTWLAIFRDIQQNIGKDDGDSDSDGSAQSTQHSAYSSMFALVSIVLVCQLSVVVYSFLRDPNFTG